jgi:hypothetical protein
MQSPQRTHTHVICIRVYAQKIRNSQLINFVCKIVRQFSFSPNGNRKIHPNTHQILLSLSLCWNANSVSSVCVSVRVCYASDNGVVWHVYQSEVNTTARILC